MVSALTPPSTWTQIDAAVPADRLAHRPDLGHLVGEERLAAEARFDGHDEDHVEVGQQVLVRLPGRWPA